MPKNKWDKILLGVFLMEIAQLLIWGMWRLYG